MRYAIFAYVGKVKDLESAFAEAEIQNKKCPADATAEQIKK